jgi:hypothetical protein
MEASIAKLSKHQISTFFSKNTSSTQQQCDQEAERLTGMSVHATSVQGGISYTVVSDNETCVVQFRSGRSALDIDLLQCVEQAYMGFMPCHQWVGYLGELYVYTMGNVGGILLGTSYARITSPSYDERCQTLPGTLSSTSPTLLPPRQGNRAADFYPHRFFALAWHNIPSQMQQPNRAFLRDEYSSELLQLRKGLPVRFGPALDNLISKLGPL